MHFTALAAALACAGTAQAWMPGDLRVDMSRRSHPRDIKSAPTLALRALDGTDLFARDTGSNSSTSSASGAAPPALKKGIRGVNIGSYLVFEPWIAQSEWQKIGCGSAKSEFDCGKALGQDGVNKAFDQHWSTFYTQDDVKQMASMGLNTIRVPVGYWLYDDIVDRNSEPFPQNGLKYLKQLCGWASDAGLYVIIDHHGAPGAQVKSNADTGQNNPNPGFYTDANFERGLKFLEWMTSQIHSNNEFRSVGAIEVLNEPLQGNNQQTQAMVSKFYPQAYQRIRAAEQKASVPDANQLHIMYMNQKWGAGDPTQSLPKGYTNVMFDDHRYIKWAANQGQSKDAYMKTSCNDDRGGEDPTVVGEWSLSAPLSVDQQNSADWDPSKNKDWYLGWFSAQARSYEKQYGWIFWTWKAFLNDARWSYTDAVKAGIIPQNLDDINANAAKACGS